MGASRPVSGKFLGWGGEGIKLLAILAAAARIKLVPFELVGCHQPGLERLSTEASGLIISFKCCFGYS